MLSWDGDYTLVIGVDRRHLEQLKIVWPSWKRHKPSLLEHPMLVFFDRTQLNDPDVRKAIDHPNLTLTPWPPEDVTYEGDPNSKWHNPQRYKMLAGFIFVPAAGVRTPYWLKLDTDVVALGNDYWIEDRWFRNDPAIVSQRWGYTKPADQMVQLDQWVQRYPEELRLLAKQPPLNLVPEPGATSVGHKRIISWCAFFHTGFTKFCAQMAKETVGNYRLPVPSQDGYLWYCARRGGYAIERTNMKDKGWMQRNCEASIRAAVLEAMRS